MAGGMTRKGDRVSLYERINGQPPQVESPPVKPCWVTDRHGRLPGLLLEWRDTGSGDNSITQHAPSSVRGDRPTRYSHPRRINDKRSRVDLVHGVRVLPHERLKRQRETRQTDL
jgi:hypothetical protein